MRPHPPPPAQRQASLRLYGEAMIAFLDLDLKQIACEATDYCWPRPCRCGRCGHPNLWGHGFVFMIFDGFAHSLRIRRYRCPVCGCVIRLRPNGYFKRHQSPATTIRKTLAARFKNGTWPRNCATNRARHWLQSLKRHALAVLGVPVLCDLLAAFDELVALGRVPVSRAI